jgi:hypothetical protein
MKRSQVREGFRRIGSAFGFFLAAMCCLIIYHDQTKGRWPGSDWHIACLIAIWAPLLFWFGSTIAQIFGWVFQGFATPDADGHADDRLDLDDSNFLKVVETGHGPLSASIVRARLKLGPYFSYVTWALAWFAADWIEFPIASSYWPDAYKLPPSPGEAGYANLISSVPFGWLWAARASVLAGAFVSFLIVCLVAKVLEHILIVVTSRRQGNI